MVFYHNIDPVLLNIGPLTLRWYGIMFALGLFSAYLVTYYIFKREKKDIKLLDSLVFYIFFGVLIGARMGEVLFYNFDYFLHNPLKVFYVWEGGLASHGAAIGILVAFLLWLKVKNLKFSDFADKIAVSIPIAAGFVRIGNFFNSEIMGKVSGSDYGVVFQKLGEDFPRHPSQLYESIIAFSIFGILFFLYKNCKKLPKNFLVTLFVFLYFSTRFLIEFVKEKQVMSDSSLLSMGQILSILPVLIAFVYFFVLFRKIKKART